MTHRTWLLSTLLFAASVAAESQGPAAPATTLPLKAARTHTFTTTTGTWMSLDVSPDGQTIVFDLLGDLYTMPISGGTATRLLGGMAYDAQPRFSPDGKKVVFVSDRSGGDNVWTISLDGKDTVQVTKGNTSEYVSPEWTPDGNYIVVSRAAGLFAVGRLWMYHVDGGSGMPLGAPGGQMKYQGAAFGKDPRYLWFASRFGDWSYNALGPQYQLGVYDRETGKTAQMSVRFGSAFRPALSPDGKWLVYATRHQTKTGLRLRNLETQDEDWLAYPVQRDETESRAPLDAYPGYSFTPDSRAIVVTYGGEIWRVPIDKSAPAKIPFSARVDMEMGPEVRFTYRVDTAATLTAKQIRDMHPSPDGTRLAFSALDKVYVMDWPNGTPVRVSNGTSGEFGPVWAPDGKSLAWTTWDDVRGGEIVRATWDDRRRAWATQTLSSARGLYLDLAWSPAGDRIVATRAAAREMQEAGAAFFGPAAADLIWVPATGGASTLIMPSGGIGNAHFTTDANRIYAYSGRDGLVSFRWDGTDIKTHLKVTGPMPPGMGGQMTLDADMVWRESAVTLGGRAARAIGGASRPWNVLGDDTEPSPPQAPPASLVMMAPRGDQALAMVGMDFYTITVPQVGAPPTISVAALPNAAVPVRKLNEVGGEFPVWSSDGRSVMWALGNAVWSYDLTRAKVVEDSLKADARAKAGVKPDTTKKDSTASKEKPGYKPVERRIAVSAARDVPRGTVVLRGARAITMKGNEIIANADILVRDNRIVAIGARGSVTIPAGTREIDVAGKTIIPGFVDTHYHPQWLTPQIHNRQVWQYLTTLAYGTTTTRDPQTAVTDFLTYGDRVETGEMVGPRIYTTGPGVFIGDMIRDSAHAEQVLKKYSDYYKTGTLKMYMTGNRQQRQWVIMAARKLGIMPTTEGGLDHKIDITHGIDGYPGIEHTLPITPKYDDVFQWYKGTQVLNSPTLIVSYGGPFGENYWYTNENLAADEKIKRFTHPTDFDGKVRRRGQGAGGSPGPGGWFLKEEYSFWQHAQDVAKTVAAGGKIGAGSHGQFQGLGMHWEIWMLASGGLPAHDALRVATLYGAEGIGMGTDIGSLEVGKMADLLVLDRDPLADIRNTNSISRVMVNGRLYDASTLDEQWPRQRPLGPMPWANQAPGVVGAGIR